MVINIRNNTKKLKLAAGGCLFLLTAGFINGRYFLPMLAGWLIHEMGHAAAGAFVNVKLKPEIGLLGIGLKGNRDVCGRQESILASGGVLANFLWGIAAGSLGLEYYYEASMVLAIINLLPVLPLDGGKILRGILSRYYAELAVTRVLAYWGQVLALVMAISIFWFDLRLWLLILPVSLYALALADLRNGEYSLAKRVAREYQKKGALM